MYEAMQNDLFSDSYAQHGATREREREGETLFDQIHLILHTKYSSIDPYQR